MGNTLINSQNCILCNRQEHMVISSNSLYRIILVEDEYYPAYIQLILNRHEKEMSDLLDREFNDVCLMLRKVECQMRRLFHPDKVNLVSLGNVVPHLHWHIIGRFITDRHFPNSIWGEVTNPNYVPDKALYQLQQQFVGYLQDYLQEIIK